MSCACMMGGGGMLWMMALPTLLLAALVIGGALVMRAFWNRGERDRSTSSPTALSLLEERYARGEIDEKELTERRAHLTGWRT